MAVVPLVVVAGSSLSDASAAIVVVAPTPTTTGSIEITEDILYVLTSAGFPNAIIFDEWVASDKESVTTFSDLQGSMNIIFNGLPMAFGGALGDNVTGPVNDFTFNDGILFLFGTPQAFPGDQLVLKAGSYALSVTNPMQGVFNPLANQTFAGNTFLTDFTAARISSNGQVVPEPGSVILLSSAGGLLMIRRSRQPRKD